MRLILDDMIQELRLRLEEKNGLRNKVLLKDALDSLQKIKDSDRNL